MDHVNSSKQPKLLLPTAIQIARPKSAMHLPRSTTQNPDKQSEDFYSQVHKKISVLTSQLLKDIEQTIILTEITNSVLGDKVEELEEGEESQIIINYDSRQDIENFNKTKSKIAKYGSNLDQLWSSESQIKEMQQIHLHQKKRDLDEINKNIKRTQESLNSTFDTLKEQSSKKDLTAAKNSLKSMEALKSIKEILTISKETNQEEMNEILKQAQQIYESANKSINKIQSVQVLSRELPYAEELERRAKAAKSVDVCFLVDCTGSMSSYIEMVKNKMSDLISNIQSKYDGAVVRVAVVGYRDVADTKRFEIHQFDDNIANVNQFIANLVATGGDDVPEDINGGIQKALALNWKHQSRIIFNIADAPCHGKKFHNQIDSYPDGYFGDIEWGTLFAKIKGLNINYVFLEITEYTNQMVRMFQSLYESVPKMNSNVGVANYFKAQKISSANPDEYLAITSKITLDTVSSTLDKLNRLMCNNLPKSSKYKIMKEIEFKNVIMCNMEVIDEDEDEYYLGTSPYGTLKELSITRKTSIECQQYQHELNLKKSVVNNDAEWEKESFWEGHYIADLHYTPPSYEELKESTLETTTSSAIIKIHTTPFAEGTFSKAYYAKIKSVDDSIAPTNIEYKFVLKVPKEVKYDDKIYQKSLQRNAIARSVAEKYNSALQKKGVDSKERVYFCQIFVADICGKKYVLEPYLPGKFLKYTNNSEYVNENVPLMTALSHFSYYVTKGDLMLTDLQGTNNLLTDPAIHSYTRELGEGDLGYNGKQAFFSHHECNAYCKSLLLATHFAQKWPYFKGAKKYPEISLSLTQSYIKCDSLFCQGNKISGKCSYCLQ